MNIVLLGRMAAGCRDALHRLLGPSFHLTAIPDPRLLDIHAADLAAAHVIVGWPLTNALLARAPNVKLVQASGAGIDGLDLTQLPPGVMAANTFHHEAAIAEWTLMAMLYLSRRPAHFDRALRSGQWDGSCIWGESPTLNELRGQTALIPGLGHIALEIARRAAAFDMHLIGVSRRPAPRPHFHEVISWDHWLDRLPDAAFVIPACPLTPETRGIIGPAVFARMAPHAFLINMTRGPVVDEQALYDALRLRRIAGAAIDTWYQYPADPNLPTHPSALPFHELDNVLMSPHISGWTRPTIEGRIDDIAENIRRLANGQELLHRLQ